MSTFARQASERTMRHRSGDMNAAGFRCRLCGDVIGVYEPLVTGADSLPRTTSRAAEPGLDPGEVYYHPVCFVRRSRNTSV